jgi:hypothetical protein
MRSILATGAVAAVLSFGGASGALADACTLTPGGGSCFYQFTEAAAGLAVSLPFGSITATEAGDGSKISFSVSISPNWSIDAGAHEAFSLNIGTLSGAPITTANLAGFGHIGNIGQTSGLGILSAFSGNPGSNPPFGNFDYALACSANGSSTNCGQAFSFDFIFATPNSGKLIPSTGDGSIWFAADICGSDAKGNCISGNTGAVGATDPPVEAPGPVVGAGLPGLLAACGSLIVMARRRRRQRIA